MNLIKFKDQVKLGDELFNKYLKSQYAWWIHMRYVVPLDFITPQEYIALESDISGLIGTPNKGTNKHYWDLFKDDKLAAYVDEEGTEEANDIAKYQIINKFTSDSDITLEEIKQFRTWLAETLLSFDQTDKGIQKNSFYTVQETHMLQYYANHMYDDTLKWLNQFGKPELIMADKQITAPVGCGCQGSTSPDLSSLYKDTGYLQQCDPIYIYKHNLYKAMIKKFQDIDFWSGLSGLFLSEFKTYIDNILRTNLTLVPSKYISNLKDCDCNFQDSEHLKAQDILRSLSQSIQYILDEDIVGHRNYISKSFQDWATQLYENMEWPNN